LTFLQHKTLILVTACSHPVPQATIDVLDTSLSITPRAKHAAQAASSNKFLDWSAAIAWSLSRSPATRKTDLPPFSAR
jgi:hypothetical protein